MDTEDTSETGTWRPWRRMHREDFADDAAWEAYQRFLHDEAVRARAHELMDAAYPTAPHPSPTLSREERRRWRDRQKCRDYRTRHADRVAEYQRAYYRAHRERITAYERTWRLTHREHLRTYRRERWRSQHDSVPQDIRSLQARELDDVVLMLRREGRTFPEIASLLHRNVSTCHSAYERTAHRQRLPLRKKRPPCDDATLLAAYHDGMTWAELARRLGYASHSGARCAYLAALERATRPDGECGCGVMG